MQLAVLCHWDLTVWLYITFVKVKKEVSVLLFSTLKKYLSLIYHLEIRGDFDDMRIYSRGPYICFLFLLF